VRDSSRDAGSARDALPVKETLHAMSPRPPRYSPLSTIVLAIAGLILLGVGAIAHGESWTYLAGALLLIAAAWMFVTSRRRL